MASVMERAKSIQGEINQLIDPHYDTSTGEVKSDMTQMKSTSDKLCELLLQHSLAYWSTSENEKVWPHPKNRFEMGLDPVDVHELLDFITGCGWSWSEVGKPIAFESIPQDKPGHQEQLGFIHALVQGSGGMLPSMTPELVKLLSVTSSHTVASVKIVEAGCRTFLKDLSHNGFLSKEQVLAKDPGFAAPMKDGLKWLCIRWEVESRCPNLPAFLQEAGNQHHGANRTVTKVQTMLQVHSRMMSNFKKLGEYRKEQVARAIERQHPTMAGQIADIADYVERWSGGNTPYMLFELNDFSKVLSFRRDIAPVTFKVLAQFQAKTMAEVPTAILKASLVAPENLCTNNVAKIVSSADLAVVTGAKKEEFIKVLSYWRVSKQWLETLSKKEGCTVPISTWIKLRGFFEVKCIMHLFQKKSGKRKAYDSLEHIANEFLDEVFNVYPEARGNATPWAYKSEFSAKGDRACKAQKTMIQYNPDGTIDGESLRALGFVVGANVQPLAQAKDFVKSHLYIIKTLGADTAHVVDTTLQDSKVDDEEVDATPVAIATLVDQWKVRASF
ncbi:unnamed protein product [Prorocentrum cordatum]|uniref:Queuosine salvage protein n=1 Tax=Prorocentrum cordatum TaxID=2364126 RepID=A0ABN9XI46_9DINO|nr:unnamed protein product [Polarella glacialis]